MAVFCSSRILNFDFTENVSDRKILKLPHCEPATLWLWVKCLFTVPTSQNHWVSLRLTKTDWDLLRLIEIHWQSRSKKFFLKRKGEVLIWCFENIHSVAFPMMIPFALFPLGSLWIKDASLCKRIKNVSFHIALTSAPFFFIIIDQLLKFIQVAKE